MIDTAMHVVICISIAASVLLSCFVASTGIGLSTVPTISKSPVLHYTDTTSNRHMNEDIAGVTANLEDVVTMASTYLYPIDQSPTHVPPDDSQITAVHGSGAPVSGRNKSSRVTMTTSITSNKTAQRTSIFQVDAQMSRTTALPQRTFENSEPPSAVPYHDENEERIEERATEQTTPSGNVMETGIADKNVSNSKLTLPEEVLRQTMISTASPYIAIRGRTSVTTLSTISNIQNAKSEVKQDLSRHFRRKEGLTDSYINHAALWITVAFVVVLLIYITVLIIYNAKRRDWHHSLPPYTRFVEESTMTDEDTTGRLQKMLRRIARTPDTEDGYSLSF